MRFTIRTRQAAKAVALAATFTALAAGSAQASTLITVTERDGIADTGLNAAAGDQINVDATSDQIWAGVLFTFKNGPQGWNQAAPDGYPRPGARKYSLLAKVAGKTYYVGNGKTFTTTKAGRVYLQINDDVANNGSDYFRAYVDVL
jgi:hypothetical protein